MSGLLCTGQHEDARMCLSVAMTAARMGASLMNHCEVLEVLKKTDENGKVVCCGARLRERFTSMSPTFTYLLFCIPTETHRNLSNKNVPRAHRFITGSGENVPRAIRFITGSGENVPRAHRFITGSGENVPRAHRFITGSGENVPRASRFITGSGENVPRASRFITGSGENASMKWGPQ